MISTVPHPGAESFSSAVRFGELLRAELATNPHFYFFSPDETTSNKLDAVFTAESRAWNLPQYPWDLPESANGRIIELLSENVLFSVMTGHLLNGEPAVMASYEAFFNVITSQIVQHVKFLQQSASVAWRPDYPAANLLSTSTCWRQDHNGFSHQSPLLISALLSMSNAPVNCLFPVDDVATVATFEFMQKTPNVVNLTTLNKIALPRWIDSNHADFQFSNGGASIFGFASDGNPDFVFTAAGDIATRESLYALDILRRDLPALRFRFVGINALTPNAIGTTVQQLSRDTFVDYFTSDRPIIANFHGYPGAFRQILANYADNSRLTVHGFNDRGSTTTPFEMLSLNHCSRYHLALDVAQKIHRPDLIQKYRAILRKNTLHAESTGLDLPELE